LIGCAVELVVVALLIETPLLVKSVVRRPGPGGDKFSRGGWFSADRTQYHTFPMRIVGKGILGFGYIPERVAYLS
jgi:hypothetical protein